MSKKKIIIMFSTIVTLVLIVFLLNPKKIERGVPKIKKLIQNISNVATMSSQDANYDGAGKAP